jgi:hypothetical protein
MKCGIIVPRREEILGSREDGYLPECILNQNHKGPHVFKTPEGKFVAWEDDWDCKCCESHEDSRCYTYFEILEIDIPKSSIQQT